MPMVRMEDSLLPVVFVDATVQIDNPRDHGERQDDQGTDEQLEVAPLEVVAATGDLRMTVGAARSGGSAAGEQWPAWNATWSPVGTCILSQAPSAGADAVVRRHAACSPEDRLHIFVAVHLGPGFGCQRCASQVACGEPWRPCIIR